MISIKNKENIMITGAGGAASIFLINHLRQNGFKVIATDSNVHSMGLLYADVGYVVPLCTSNNFVSTINNICEKEKISFIIPLIDEELLLMKRLESAKIKVICPSEKFINSTLDKFCLMQELSKIGIPVPKTFLLSQDYSSIEFPVVIKPRQGRGSRDVFFANNKKELNKIIDLKKDYLDNFILQKKIEGSEYTVSAVVNPENKFISAVPKKIIEKIGITRSAITEENQKISCICKIIAEKLIPLNPFNVQLMISSFDGNPYVFEINPRFSTTVNLTITAGIDEIMVPINFYINPNLNISSNFISDLVLLRSVKEDFVKLEEYNKQKTKIIETE